MNDSPNEKPTELAASTLKRPLGYFKAFLITGIISLTVTALSMFCMRHADVFLINYVIMTVVALPMLFFFAAVVGLLPYWLLGKTSQHFLHGRLHIVRLGISFFPIWGLALFSVFSVCRDHIYGPAVTLGIVTENTVSADETEDLRDDLDSLRRHPQYTVYFRTKPEVVDRLLKLYDYKQKWPIVDANLEEEERDSHQSQLKIRITPHAENWPDPFQWTGVEIFCHTKKIASKCEVENWLITDKKYQKVILKRARVVLF